MRAEEAYEELMRRVRETALLDSCAMVLSWDEETCMPRGGVEHRGNQMALLAGLGHDWATHPRIGELLGELEGSPLLSDPLCAAAVNVRELRRCYNRATRLPRSLVEELARAVSFAQQEWTGAREDSDFPRFRPWLERVLALKRAEAECLDFAAPYDALLDEHEPGARRDDLAVLFDGLRRELTPLLNAVTYSSRRPNLAILHRNFALERQKLFIEETATAVGFDFGCGRLDTSAHPFFSTIGPGDCRITTRYNANNFADAFFAALHEVGHALYEQGLDPVHHGTPMGEAASLGMHEAQARLYENLVGRSRPFWQHFLPRARRVFHDALRDVKLDSFHFAVNHVEPSCIRVGSDEVSYNLHILVRFELEQALVSGNLKVDDLPAAWNESYLHHLGVQPENEAEGCLQDSHWAAGLFGYFPSYTLGNIFAAQLFARAEQELGDLDRQLARGHFDGLLGWLRERVYRQGSRYPAAGLVQHATGSPSDPAPLVQMLRRKYGELYRL